MSRTDLIRAIQRAEGNSDCFATMQVNDCYQMNCLWRVDYKAEVIAEADIPVVSSCFFCNVDSGMKCFVLMSKKFRLSEFIVSKEGKLTVYSERAMRQPAHTKDRTKPRQRQELISR
jgi:hypothetical protein